MKQEEDVQNEKYKAATTSSCSSLDTYSRSTSQHEDPDTELNLLAEKRRECCLARMKIYGTTLKCVATSLASVL